MGRFSKNVMYYTFVMGIIMYKFHTSLLNAFLLTLLPWKWQHQVSPAECLLCHGWSYWQPFTTWAWLWTQTSPCGLVWRKVTLQQDFCVIIFFLLLSFHWCSVLTFLYAMWSYQLALLLNKTLILILFFFLMLLFLLLLIHCWYIQLGLISATPFSLYLPIM